MGKTYIFGHQNPDTDSVCSAIALSYLKNKLGENTEPRILGDINNETKFVLNYFNIDKPKYLNDVKLRVKDLDFDKHYYLTESNSIYKCFMYMNEHSISTLPIIDNNNIFKGIISMKDIAKDLILRNNAYMCTSYDNILETLNGEEILKFEEEIEGNILIPSFRSTTFINTVSINHDSILVTGDRHSIHEFAINNFSKLLILTGNSFIKEEHIELAKKNKVNIIKTNYSSFDISRLIHLCNYVQTITNETNIVYFDEDDYVDDFIKLSNKTKYSNYPVLNSNKECLGILSLSDLSTANKTKVILVDHNEVDQSVIGIEDAEILEIVDHHKIGSLATSIPISFRNMPVGSTNTIIYSLYKENNIDIPREIAVLMISGIISDTLLLSSPTTTEKDEVAIKELAMISELDYNLFAQKMFEEGSSLKDLTIDKIFYSDFKNFSIKDDLIGIGQITTTNPKEIIERLDDFINFINLELSKKEYKIFALFITDILKKGSYILFNDNANELLSNAFNIENISQASFIPNCLSRKKQIIPKIIDAIEKSN